jgi:phosphoglycerol transferase MdoB-like AlkP superfamily enzyme
MGPETPYLAKLASEGLSASNMRSVLPHTSKALFSLLCGKYPAMQHEILETADNYGMYCLPSILREKGYATAFFQSGDGRFEDRPRLAERMGFGHFEALQDLSPAAQPLGYLAGDDMGLVQPVLRWARQQVEPFFITVLTSSTHHTYDVPDRILKQDGFSSAKNEGAVSRYLLLVHYLDIVLSKTVDALTAAGKMGDSVIVVAGDHGEAFGEHSGYQHDNIAWEEGLHVPYVVRSPGRVPAGQVVPGERSLLDTAPTILDLAGIGYLEERFDGRTLMRKEASPVRRYFSCWYSNVCVGYVEDLTKLIYMPSVRSWVVYNLATDPLEHSPLVDPPEWRDRALGTYQWYNEHRFTDDGLKWARSSLFGGTWSCGERQEHCRPSRR